MSTRSLVAFIFSYVKQLYMKAYIFQKYVYNSLNPTLAFT